MHTLPLPARIYLLVVCLSAGAVAIALLPYSGSLLATPLLTAACLLGVIVAQQAAVTLEVQTGHRMVLTVDEAVALFCVSALGPSGIFVLAGSVAIGALRRGRPWERVLFNAAMIGLAYTCAAFVYRALQPADAIPYSGPSGPLTLLLVAGTYYASNNLLVSTMVALATRQPVLRVYRENLQQASWAHLLTFIIGATMAALYSIDKWLLLYGVLTLVTARHAFATVVALTSETRKRQALAEERAKLYEERARLYEELHTTSAELTRASKLAALGTFAAGIAHEFNNILTAIIGNAQVGQMADSFAEKDYSLNVIGRVCQRATSITASLLTFARQREPDLERNRLQIVINDTLALVRHDLAIDKINLVTEIEELPPILCDLGQIGQVLLNLITNSRDALRDQVGGQITLCLQTEHEHALLTIADNGPGISPDLLDKIFQPFITTKKKGNGLGMAICYGIIESHKGSISIDSTIGQGTTVTIRLPLCAETTEAYTTRLLAEA